MSTSPTAAVDRLLAAAHGARSAMDYCRFQALDIDADGLADPLEVLDDARDNLAHALAVFTRYSDGRPIRSTIEIIGEMPFTYTWPPTVDYSDDAFRFVCRGALPHDGAEENGHYEIWARPATSELRVEHLAPTPRPRLEVVQ
ncbi:hypothetical protein [Gordonia sp. (in: high G+C Gram-positive bacteria)]|uniref:hypothetical protein n=1 Tax=Gordonia sp. (in: high G+C Gram-positive bacteria) TaxID=84139 RepID=UPI0026192993|nr:hypothetical protein [Gordonia sp. (in: high G+C Gram-positive bacteria)]